MKKIEESHYESGSISYASTTLVNYDANGEVANIGLFSSDGEFASNTVYERTSGKITTREYIGKEKRLGTTFVFFLNGRNLVDSMIQYFDLNATGGQAWNDRTKIIYNSDGILVSTTNYTYENDILVSTSKPYECTIENKRVVKQQRKGRTEHILIEYYDGLKNNLPGFHPEPAIQWVIYYPFGINLCKAVWSADTNTAFPPKEKITEFSYEFDSENRVSVQVIKDVVNVHPNTYSKYTYTYY